MFSFGPPVIFSLACDINESSLEITVRCGPWRLHCVLGDPNVSQISRASRAPETHHLSQSIMVFSTKHGQNWSGRNFLPYLSQNHTDTLTVLRHQQETAETFGVARKTSPGESKNET